MKTIVGIWAILWAGAASASTDFGIRLVSPAAIPTRQVPSLVSAKLNLATAARIGSKYGQVTSMLRSPEHNRRVGGVRNSYHLSGRAIDIARARGVSHADLEHAYRGAGYRIIESLDEGDHSHFAFASGAAPTPRLFAQQSAVSSTTWRIVEAPK